LGSPKRCADAADFKNANGTQKGEFRQNQFGVTAGGRIIRNKTFCLAIMRERESGRPLRKQPFPLLERDSGL
jgi:hypothetical protein